MKFVVIYFIFLFVSARLVSAQGMPSMGCSFHRPILFCRGQLPHGEDLQNSAITSLVLFQQPEGTWLSLEEPHLSDSGIQKIEIKSSSIAKVDPGYFAQVAKNSNLKRLTLRNVQGAAVVDKSMLQGLEQSLNYLTVTNGLTVNVADLSKLAQLTSLELMGTNVIGTMRDFENLLPRLRSLSVQKCNLTQLPWEALAKWMAEDNLRRLKIDDNNWTCDCSMMKIKRLKSGIVPNELQKLICSGPPNLAGKQLSDLTENDLCPMVELNSNKVGEKGKLEAFNSKSNVGAIDGDSGIGPPRELPEAVSQEEKNGSVRTDILIAGTVVGVLVLAFVVFIIAYKCRLYPTRKSLEEKTSKTHQNKRYVNVIEEPPLRRYGNGDQAKENTKFTEGVPV